MALRFSILDRPSIRRFKVGEKITVHGITAERLAAGDLSYSVNVMVDAFATPAIDATICALPAAASLNPRPMSLVVTDCSSTADAIVIW